MINNRNKLLRTILFLILFLNIFIISFGEDTVVKTIDISKTTMNTNTNNNNVYRYYYLTENNNNNKISIMGTNSYPTGDNIITSNQYDAEKIAKYGITSTSDINNVRDPDVSEVLVKYGYTINDYDPIIDDVNSLSKEVKELKDKTDLSAEDKKELEQKESELNDLIELIDVNNGWGDILNSNKVDKDELLKQYEEAKCGDTMIVSYLCKTFTNVNEDDLIRESYINKLKETEIVTKDLIDKYDLENTCDVGDSIFECNSKLNTVTEDIIKNNYLTGICDVGDSIESCNIKIENYNSESEENSFDKLETSNKISFDIDSRNEIKANVFLENNNIKGGDIYTYCSGDLNSESCIEAVDNCEETCSDCDCNKIKDDFEIAYDLSEREDSMYYTLLKGLFQPSEDALQAAKLFGFEADYSNVPDVLRQSFPSQVCEAKIDGYLDKDIEVLGGTSQYGSCTEEIDAIETNEDKNKCSQVIGDIRAQRTQITPDLKTDITYSAFIRAPSSGSVKLIIALSYKLKNGELNKLLITDNATEISNGEIKSIYEHVNLLINKTSEEVDENSFKIYLLAVHSDNSQYLNLVTPVYLMTFDDRTASIYDDGLYGEGNDEGNLIVTNEGESRDISTDEMLSWIN